MKNKNNIFVLSLLLITIMLTSFTLGDSLGFTSPKDNTSIVESPSVYLRELTKDYLGISIDSDAIITHGDIEYLRLDRVDSRSLSKDLSSSTRVINNKNKDAEIIFKSVKTTGKIEDVIISDKYVSLKGFSSDDLIKVRMYTGNHDVPYQVMRHDDYAVSSNKVREEGEVIVHEVLSDKGYIDYYTTGFSTQVAFIPDIYIGSIAGELGERWVEIHEYTNKRVQFVVVPNFATSQSVLIYPETNYNANTHVIDGVKYELVESGNRDDFFLDVVTSGTNQNKDLRIQYKDGDYEIVPLRVRPTKTEQLSIIPSYTISDFSTSTLYLPFYMKKSNILVDGYKRIPAIHIWENNPSRTGAPDRVMSISNEEIINGNALKDYGAYIIELINDESLKITSKDVNIELNFRIFFSNNYYATHQNPDITISVGSTPIITDPLMVTNTPTSLNAYEATLRGSVDEVGSNPVSYGFEYRTGSSGSFSFLGNIDSTSSPINYFQTLTGLNPSTTYEYRARGYDGSNYFYGDIEQFTTQSVSIENPPTQNTPLPQQFSVGLGASISFNVHSRFDDFDFIDISFIDPDTPGFYTLINMPLFGSTTISNSKFDIIYDSNGDVTVIGNDDYTTELIFIVTNEYGSITREMTATIGAGTTPPVVGDVTQQDLLNGLVSYWDGSFNSLTAFDVHGTNDGTANDARVFGTDGQILGGFDFTKGNDYVEISSDSSLDFTTAMSISMWYKPTSLKGVLIAKRSSTQYAWDINIGSDGTLYFGINSNTNRVNTGSFKLSSDTFYHLTFTYDKSNIKIYVDGVERGTFTYSTNINTNTQPVYIGRRGAGFSAGDTGYVNGLMDEVAIYDRALLSDEVFTLHDIQKDGFEDGSYDFEVLSGEPVVTDPVTSTTMPTVNMLDFSTASVNLNTYFENAESYFVEYTIDGTNYVLSLGDTQTNNRFTATLTNAGNLVFDSKNVPGQTLISVTGANSVNSETETFYLNIDEEVIVTNPPGIISTPTDMNIQYETTGTINFETYYSDFDEIVLTFDDSESLTSYGPISSSETTPLLQTTNFDASLVSNNNFNLEILAKTTSTTITVSVTLYNDYGTTTDTFDVNIVPEVLQVIKTQDVNDVNLSFQQSVMIPIDDYFSDYTDFRLEFINPDDEQGKTVIDSTELHSFNIQFLESPNRLVLESKRRNFETSITLVAYSGTSQEETTFTFNAEGVTIPVIEMGTNQEEIIDLQDLLLDIDTYRVRIISLVYADPFDPLVLSLYNSETFSILTASNYLVQLNSKDYNTNRTLYVEYENEYGEFEEPLTFVITGGEELLPSEPGYFDDLFGGLFPPANDLSTGQQLQIMLMSIGFVLLCLVIINHQTHSRNSQLLTSIGGVSVVLMFFLFTYMGYIPIWLVVTLVLLLIAIGVGKARNVLVSSGSGDD